MEYLKFVPFSCLILIFMDNTTLESRFEQLREYFIGVWRFRHAGYPVKFCCTFCYDGEYFDTGDQDTPFEALTMAVEDLNLLHERKTGEKLFPEDATSTITQVEFENEAASSASPAIRP